MRIFAFHKCTGISKYSIKGYQQTLQIHIHNATVTEVVQSVHTQLLQHKPSVTFKIPSQTC